MWRELWQSGNGVQQRVGGDEGKLKCGRWRETCLGRRFYLRHVEAA
jgi:hypothetical protein